ncbi:hypothetical protein NW759_003080 [Fusarium solani]|nr:hypothetical protein NW759_003080 [Fusarium solani]
MIHGPSNTLSASTTPSSWPPQVVGLAARRTTSLLIKLISRRVTVSWHWGAKRRTIVVEHLDERKQAPRVRPGCIGEENTHMASSLGVARMDFVEKRGLQRNERTRDKKRVNASNKQQPSNQATKQPSKPPLRFPPLPHILGGDMLQRGLQSGE